jgi:diguanylate cyclase (GGDEF)-like protein
MILPIPEAATIAVGLFLVLAVIGLGICAVWQNGRTLAAQRRVRQAGLILQAADSVLIGLQNIETGQRGYLLTNDQRYLQPFNRGNVDIKHRIMQLAALLPATPANQRLIANMRLLASEKLAEINQTIQLRKTQGFAAAASVVRTNVGKQLMDALRADIFDIKSTYSQAAIYQSVLAARRLALTKLITAAFGVVLLIVLLGMYVRFVRDVHQRRRLADDLNRHANDDPLTQLPNRALFMNWLTYGLAQAQRVNGKAAVLFMDLDGFKPVNDRLGHSAGDRVLQEVSRRFRQSSRTGDMIARIGGDEFAVFIPTLANESDPAELAHRLIEAMRQPIVAEGSVVYVGVSIGAAMYPRNGNNPEALLAAADQAMYRAKREGGRKFSFHTSALTDQIAHETRLRGGLQQAIQAREFVFHYQPLLDAQTLKPVAVEALLRWRHPELGLLMPGEFLPIAERSGMMRKLAPVLLQAAGEQVATWRRQGFKLRLAMNVSPFQCSDQNLVSVVESALTASGLEPQHLDLEITESGLLNAEAQHNLQHLRQMGVGLTLDDFGGGAAGLACLRRLMINRVKFDRSFIGSLHESSPEMNLLAGLMDLSHRLGIQVAAGGVETVNQATIVRRVGCDLLQGNLYASAASADDCQNFLHGWKAA